MSGMRRCTQTNCRAHEETVFGKGRLQLKVEESSRGLEVYSWLESEIENTAVMTNGEEQSSVSS